MHACLPLVEALGVEIGKEMKSEATGIFVLQCLHILEALLPAFVPACLACIASVKPFPWNLESVAFPDNVTSNSFWGLDEAVAIEHPIDEEVA